MRKLAIFLLLALLLSTPAMGADTAALEGALPETAREVLGDMTVSDVMEGRGVFPALWDWIKRQVSEKAAEAARGACVVLTVTLLCSAAGVMSENGKTPGYMLLGGALAILGACAGDIRSFLGQTQTAMATLSDFSRALLPCVAASAAAAGDASASARYTASALFLDILMTLGAELILPMIYAFCVTAAADAALPEGALGGPVKLMRWGCTTLLAGLTTVFTLCLTVSGAVAGSAGKLAGSVAKTAISAALPVVGSILSDAADAYLAGAQLVRGAVGVFGLAAVLCVCAGPAVGLGLRYLLFKAAACVCEPFSDGRLAALVGNIASAYGMALGLVGSAGAMLFISVVLGMGVLTG